MTQALDSMRFPRFAQLPSLMLYMDQVTIVLNEALSPFTFGQGDAATPTMINNYVKLKLVTPSVKKRYGREQLAQLIIVSLLKHALSIAEISAVLKDLTDSAGIEAGYDLFCECLEGTLQGGSMPQEAGELLSAAAGALAGKLRFEAVLSADKA